MSAQIDTEDLEELSISMPQQRRTPQRPSDPSPTPQPPIIAVHDTKTKADRKAIQRLGQYTIVKTLGEGSFGKVKLATHQVSGQKVALKVINRKQLVTRDMAGRIEREIQYLQLLRHPHIIKLYTVITTPTDIIMVLEYAGGELFDYIVNNGRLPETQARKFFQQIVCAVEYCHRHKIVHRDLKPENVLVVHDDDGHEVVKLVDFGIFKLLTGDDQKLTRAGLVFGTPRYMSPEQVSGGKIDERADLYAVGIVLFEMLTGAPPFDADQAGMLMRMHVLADVPPLPDTPLVREARTTTLPG